MPALEQYRLEHVYRLRDESQEIKQNAPTGRGWAGECCGVMRAICIFPPEVVPIASLLG